MSAISFSDRYVCCIAPPDPSFFETIYNVAFHVSSWTAMIIGISAGASYLRNRNRNIRNELSPFPLPISLFFPETKPKKKSKE